MVIRFTACQRWDMPLMATVPLGKIRNKGCSTWDQIYGSKSIKECSSLCRPAPHSTDWSRMTESTVLSGIKISVLVNPITTGNVYRLSVIRSLLFVTIRDMAVFVVFWLILYFLYWCFLCKLMVEQHASDCLYKVSYTWHLFLVHHHKLCS